MAPLTVLLAVTGLATIALGIVHVVIPRLIDVEHAVPALAAPLRPLPVVGPRYRTRREDVLGVIWVSNNAATWVLLTLGTADLLAARWVGTDAGRLLAIWAAGWWAIRGASQLAFGRRAGDWALMATFATAAAIHAAAALP
ncbi:MAG: hypothetical protein U0869_09175 [Chloroflexota bacterium]